VGLADWTGNALRPPYGNQINGLPVKKPVPQSGCGQFEIVLKKERFERARLPAVP